MNEYPNIKRYLDRNDFKFGISIDSEKGEIFIGLHYIDQFRERCCVCSSSGSLSEAMARIELELERQSVIDWIERQLSDKGIRKDMI